MRNNVYIHGGLRSPIGVVHGQYRRIRPEYIGIRVLEEVVHQCKVNTNQLDGIICGNAVGTGGNIGRYMALHHERLRAVPVTTIDMQCASAGAAIHMGAALIAAQMGHNYIVGGIESSSLQPLRIFHEDDNRAGSYKVAPFSPQTDLYDGSPNPLAMIEGAERTAQLHGISREELDAAAYRSHRLANSNHHRLQSCQCVMDSSIYESSQYFDDTCYRDESLRPHMSERLLQRMPLLLGSHTVTTAGNSCLTHDGAAFVVLSSHVGPFKMIGVEQWAGLHPERSPEGALEASQKVLHACEMTMDDMDVIEWNEAFAVIDVLFARAYPHLVDRYNSWGGALAYGHPYGASGAIILLHAMERLKVNQGRYGLCAIAGAGGTGTACIIEYLGHEK